MICHQSFIIHYTSFHLEENLSMMMIIIFIIIIIIIIIIDENSLHRPKDLYLMLIFLVDD